MLGSLSEADDAVQEAWLRLSRSDADAVANLGGWLTTVVARVCLDMLRSRRSRREELVGTSLPEPILSHRRGQRSGPSGRAGRLGRDRPARRPRHAVPAERLAFVLHDMFGVPFEEIAPIVDRTPAAARQLASRARRRVRGAAPSPDPDLARQREVVAAFLAAARAATSTRCSRCSTPTSSSASTPGAARTPGRRRSGAPAVARELLTRAPRFAPLARPAIVNGAAGLYLGPAQRPAAVVGFTVVGGRIAAIDLVVDREKLRQAVGD